MESLRDIETKMHKGTILVTGGAGYIGSHTCVELLQAGYDVVIADNLCNSHYKAIEGIEAITGGKAPFFHVDVCDKVKLSEIFQQYRFDAVLLECSPDFAQNIDRLHRINPVLPVVAYDDNPDHAKTRTAFLCGAMDVLKIHGITSDDAGDVLERIFNHLSRSSTAEDQYQIRSIHSVAQRGQSFMRQLLDGTPPTFYMNGNRATLIRANIICTQPTPLWQQDAAWEWIQEFGAGNSFLFESSAGELRVAAILEQDYVNTASFKRMLNTRLERCYNRLSELRCICVSTHCSSDYLSLAMLHRLDSIADLAFYMDECQTIPDSTRRAGATFPSQVYTDFCSAAALRDASTAIACIDQAVARLRNDLPAPAFAREKLNRFLWEFASVVGSRGDRAVPLVIDDSRLRTLRDSIVNIVRSTLAADAASQPVSPLDELIRRIEANPGLPINIDQAAEEINFSRSHFCRLFRQQTGLSFTAFLTQKRIAMACDLLKKTGMRVDEISDIVGISNTWYFKKLFQKETGMAVEDWIAQNRENDLPAVQ